MRAGRKAALILWEKVMSEKGKREVKKTLVGVGFALPIIIGIVGFTLFPMLVSLYNSFFEYDVLNPRKFIGFENYIRPFKNAPYGYWDQGFSSALFTTFIYALVSIPLGLVLSYLLALLVNVNLKGSTVFRVLYYVPVILPAVVSGLLWSDLLDVDFGFVNILLRKMGLPDCTFFSSKDTAMTTFIGMSLFGLGGNIILWTAQFKNIPVSMYEAAELEGASSLRKLISITIPLSSAMIFYMFVTGVIGSLQVFAQSFLLTGVAPDALNFYVVYVYNQAFSRMSMGYASALSWILFIIIGLITMLIFKTSKWVYYGEEQ